MKVILDTNILISALIKDSITRRIIFESGLNFYYPEISLNELHKHTNLILKKSNMGKKDLDLLLNRLLNYIRLIPEHRIVNCLNEANILLGHIDHDDVVFIAAALISNAAIWSDDKHFQKQKSIKIFTTKDMIEELKDN